MSETIPVTKPRRSRCRNQIQVCAGPALDELIKRTNLDNKSLLVRRALEAYLNLLRLGEQYFGGVDLAELLAKDPHGFLEVVAPGHFLNKTEEARLRSALAQAINLIETSKVAGQEREAAKVFLATYEDVERSRISRTVLFGRHAIWPQIAEIARRVATEGRDVDKFKQLAQEILRKKQ